jgi:DNA (cytosine-5)-methyltransferase 1
MTDRPLLLDLFCGAGGAAVGYHRAGFDVVGVDIADQPHYPFTFHQGDAMTWQLDGYDAVHASPPCQMFTAMSNRWRGRGGRADQHIDLLTPTRHRFHPLAVPWVIENVVGARSLMAGDVLVLHGGMFSLGVNRPRLFESNVLLLAGPAPRTRDAVGVYGRAPDGRTLWRKPNGNLALRAPASVAEAAQVMGIDWCPDWRGIAEAIPPAYTEHIGAQLLEHLT